VAQAQISTVRHSPEPSEQYPIPGVVGLFVGGDVGGDVGCLLQYNNMTYKEGEVNDQYRISQ
jgi:hypothetical protein